MSTKGRAFIAGDCAAAPDGFLLNGSIYHKETQTNSSRRFPFLLRLDLSGNVVKYEELDHSISSGTSCKIYHKKDDAFIYQNQIVEAREIQFSFSFERTLSKTCTTGLTIYSPFNYYGDSYFTITSDLWNNKRVKKLTFVYNKNFSWKENLEKAQNMSSLRKGNDALLLGTTKNTY